METGKGRTALRLSRRKEPGELLKKSPYGPWGARKNVVHVPASTKKGSGSHDKIQKRKKDGDHGHYPLGQELNETREELLEREEVKNLRPRKEKLGS